MADIPELAVRFRDFARTTETRAPLYRRLSLAIADDDELLALLQVAPAEQQLPVLLFAAVHHLLLAGHGPELAAHYPNLAPSPPPGDPAPIFQDFCRHHGDELRAIIAERTTQTNEVGRCALLLPALTLVAQERGSLAQVDVGSSAGLNLLWHRYSYAYLPGGTVGTPSPVHLDCATRGPVPVPARLPPRASGIGLDLAPIDVHDDEAVRWLEACVWPDQGERFQRLVAAVALARAVHPDVRRGDAVEHVASLVREAARSGHPVLTTTWVLNYLGPAGQAAFVAELDQVGAELDLSWVIAESPAHSPSLPVPTTATPEELTVLSLVRWRDGVRTVERLATTHPHGFWLHWETSRA